jgi:alanine dehydrogenase
MTFALLDGARLEAALDWPGLIEALRAAFAAGGIEAPPRQVLSLELPDGGTASLLLMPAWESGRAIGVKVVTFFSRNAALGRPTINAGYLLFDGESGAMRATLDGDALTARRTAAASALAADYLARPDAEVLLVVGTGQLARAVAAAHCTVRRYCNVLVWGRAFEKAGRVARALAEDGLPARPVADLEAGCREADVVSTVTASTVPLVLGSWLRPGVHLDLIGAFKEDMRESDDAAVVEARVFVDGREGALRAGDLAQPVAAGILKPEAIVADLSELARGTADGRRSAEERTAFKSVGLALEDLVAARLAAGM